MVWHLSYFMFYVFLKFPDLPHIQKMADADQK